MVLEGLTVQRSWNDKRFSVAIKALVCERAFAYEAECQVGYC